MIVEQNTNYAYKLNYMGNPTFDKVRDLSTKFYRELPQALQGELFEALNRGIDILDSEPQMTAYLFAFGKMHQAKLNYAFGKLPKEFLDQPETNVIDYGCGQALGTMCYADFLRENGYEQKVKNITLIEPSEICLKRAALNASVFFSNAEIKTVNKKFDDLTQDDIVCNEETPTLHILSNVLDMLNFDLDKFAELVKGCLKGYNQFVCVGPYFNFPDKDERMDSFCSELDGITQYNKYFNKHEFEIDKVWTAQIQGFSIEKSKKGINLSTQVTEEELANAVADEFGVLYSSDGNKCLMLDFQRSHSILYNECYRVKDGTKIICDYAFDFSASDWCPLDGECSLQLIQLPNTVIKIGNYAFASCNCVTLNIPESLSYIGENPFKSSHGLSLITDSTRFCFIDKMFVDCVEGKLISYFGNQNKIEIPSSIRHIGNYSFYGCKSLNDVSVPNTVMSIGDFAFGECGQLQTINIPKSINRIGKNPFLHCDSEIHINNQSPKYHIENNLLINKDEGLIISSWGNDKYLSIPNNVSIIGDSAFKYNKAIKQITIPEHIHEIQDHACENCWELEQLIIPYCNRIGNWAFAKCELLKQVIIKNDEDEIDFYLGEDMDLGDYVFQDCARLEQVIIPNHVNIGKNPFAIDKFYRREILINCSSERYIIKDQMLIDKEKKCLISYFGNNEFNECVIIPDGITKIGERAFIDEGLTICIPDSVSIIEKNAFDCLWINRLIIPEGSSNDIMRMLDDSDLWNELVAEKRIIEQ